MARRVHLYEGRFSTRVGLHQWAYHSDRVRSKSRQPNCKLHAWAFLAFVEIEERLWVKTDVGGVARLRGRCIKWVSAYVDEVPCNPWFICTLWLAQYKIALAQTREDLKSAMSLIEWVIGQALPSGVLAEQVNPYTDAPLSVADLSHSQLVIAVMEDLKKFQYCRPTDSSPSFHSDTASGGKFFSKPLIKKV